jgi:SAM-dependent methyltransferase
VGCGVKTEILKKVGAFYDNVKRGSERVHWWSSKTIWRHCNRVIYGNSLEEANDGFHRLISEAAGKKNIRTGISIGCGFGQKETALIMSGIVEEFICYEVSENRLNAFKKTASLQGVADKIRFCLGDAFEICQQKDIDMIYWNNSLHHMLDTFKAVRWSHDMLKPGGLFAMFDYTGPSRFQYSEEMLYHINSYRAALPDHLKRHHRPPHKVLLSKVVPISPAALIEQDPSEAADSENILPAVRTFFPDARVIPCGGLIYHVALCPILTNFPEESPDLKMALYVDELLTAMDLSLYAVALARKGQ